MLETAELITAAELARRLHISVQTLAIWRLKEGLGPPYFRAGGRILYSLADVEFWLASRKRASTSESVGAGNSAAE